MRNIRGLILDMDGVLWRAHQPLGDLPALFARLDAIGIRSVFVTNNATRSVAQYVDKLRGLGVEVTEDRILNSAQAAAHVLQKMLSPGEEVYVLGEEGLANTLKSAGFRIASEAGRAKTAEQERKEASEQVGKVAAVVVALDRQCTYAKLREAALLVRRGALFIGTNPDRTYPTPEGLVPGAGALIAALEAATDQHARVVGKPQPLLFQMALERLGTRPEETLVVGDRLETDIAGGQAAGCRTALVLSGVTTKAQAMQWRPAPDLIAPDFTAVVELLTREHAWKGKRVVTS